jgi:PadR family transcriptional regulator, regulatory protein AphA
MTIQSTTEYVVLGALMSGAKHGYEIMQFLSSALEDTWRLGTSQLYLLLKRLEKRGYLESFAENQESRPPKRIFRLTPEGSRVFLEWLRDPVEHVRDFRMEFLSKMFFFYTLSLPGAKDLLKKQIRVMEERLEKIRKRKDKQTGFSRLVYGFKAKNVESLLSWLAQEASPFVEGL